MGKKLIIKGADFSENGITPDNSVNLTQSMILPNCNYYIINEVSKSNLTTLKGGFIDITQYVGYNKLSVIKKTGAIIARVGFLTQLPTAAGQAISWAVGYSDYITINDDVVHDFSVPSNANYIYVMYYNVDANGDTFPQKMVLSIE